MENRETWCTDTVSKLTNEDTRITTLTELKETFSVLPQDEANHIAGLLQLPLVFDCLNDSKTEQIELACEVLTLCMSSLNLGESTTKYITSLERALYHPVASVKLMALKELKRTASNIATLSQIYTSPSLLTALVKSVGDDSLSVAKMAAAILVHVGKTGEGMRQLLEPQVNNALAATLAISDTVRFRIYKIIIDIARESEECLQILRPTGLMSMIIGELDTNDALLKLNVIELFSNLAAVNHGLQFLEQELVVQKIINNLMRADKDDPYAILILPGYVRFFGNVCHMRPMQTFTKYPSAINAIFNIIRTADLSILGVAYDTLGYIAATNEGKFALQTHEQQLHSTIKLVGEQLVTLPTELCVRGLNCLENLFQVDEKHLNNRVSSLVQTWFLWLDPQPVALLVKYAQNPFMEIRCAGLSVLLALSAHMWGQQLIEASPGLIEFLLNRRIESAKESKEIKYEIIKTLSTSSIFNETTLNRMQQYVREGPFYVQTVTEVEVDGTQ